MIVVDDLGIGDLSCYGAKDLQSPNIDRMVSQGLKFTNAYANCPVCSPTRASLLTGRYPELVGVPGVIRTHAANNWGYLAPEATLLPQVLKVSGYHCGIVGKWHLGLEKPNRPNDRGFDEFHGYLGDMMDDYYKHRRHGINYMRRNEKEIDPQGHATDLFTKWAIEFIKTESRKPSPFFLYLAYNAPHTPIQPPEEWFKKVKSRDPSLSDQRAKLIALIEHMDDGIGQVLQSIQDSKIDKETLIVFVSDNGGQTNVGGNNGPWRDGKQSMYEGGIRVPCCVVWPSKITPGSTSQERIMTMDFLPTLAEITSAKAPANVDGISLASIFSDASVKLPSRDLFFHRREGGNRYGGMITNALIRGDWKLVRNTPWTPLELYNLKEDPQESKDLAQTQKGKFNELSVALRAHIQRGGRIPWQK